MKRRKGDHRLLISEGNVVECKLTSTGQPKVCRTTTTPRTTHIPQAISVKILSGTGVPLEKGTQSKPKAVKTSEASSMQDCASETDAQSVQAESEGGVTTSSGQVCSSSSSTASVASENDREQHAAADDFDKDIDVDLSWVNNLLE